MSDAATPGGPAPRRRTKTPVRRKPAADRRPLERAQTWAKARWESTRQTIAQTRFKAPQLKRPSNRALAWIGGILAVVAIAIAILVAIWDWNWFKGPLERIASGRMHRQVTIAGDLNVDIFSWRPSATVDGIRVANPAWAGPGDTAAIERIAVQIRLVPLLRGRVDLQLLRFDRPNVRLFRDLQGRATWDFSGGKPSTGPLRLPPIRSFIIKDGQLRFEDVQRKITLAGTINASEQLGETNRGFEMTGKGSINREAFSLQVVGGPLLNIERDKPYPFDAEIKAGDTYVTAKGAIPKPFDLGQFYMDTTARGPDLGDLYGLTGVALPNTPPYRLTGRLSRDDNIWRIDRLAGTVGDSDLAGEISIKTGEARPILKANLRSRSLDFDDLGAIFGGAPGTGAGETANAGQKVVAAKLAGQARLLPDTTLAVDKIRAIDADVSYKALSIRDAPVRLRSGEVRVRLENGLLRANPLEFDLPQGTIAGFVNLDARKKTPVTELDLKLTNARIEQLIPMGAGGRPPLTGQLVGRAKLTGTGDSVRKAFASADGQVLVISPGAEVREAFAELLGINVVKGLGLLLSKNQDTVPVYCAVANFTAVNGVLSASNIVFDTKPVLGRASGTINMGTERMDLTIRGKAKDFQLIRLLAPITVKGPITAPKVGVEAGGIVAQGGVAVALGALVGPLAAIIPFVELGTAKDANCAALITSQGRQGVPAEKPAKR